MPAPFTVLTERDRRDIGLWLGWSAIAGHRFTSGKHAARELVRHALRSARGEWLAMPRAFRKLLLVETMAQMERRLVA